MNKNEFPPAFTVGQFIENVVIEGDISAPFYDTKERSEKTVTGTIIEVNHVVRSVYDNKAHYDYQYVIQTNRGFDKFWHSPTFLPPREFEPSECLGCGAMMNEETDYIAYCHCVKCTESKL